MKKLIKIAIAGLLLLCLLSALSARSLRMQLPGDDKDTLCAAGDPDSTDLSKAMQALGVSADTCEVGLYLSGSLQGGTYEFEASSTIWTTHVLDSGAFVTYSAGDMVTLAAGFTMQPGSALQVNSEGCVFTKMGSLSPSESLATSEFTLDCHPNPFQDIAWISYRVPADAPLKIEVFDLAGKRLAVLVEESNLAAGSYTVPWDTGALRAGHYILRLISGSHRAYVQLVHI